MAESSSSSGGTAVAGSSSSSGGPVLILDNGGGTIKAGFLNTIEPRIIPNCISKAKSERRRPFIGDQLDDCRDPSGLFFILPFSKGYMTAGDIEKKIWEYVISPECLRISPHETNLLITEPAFNFVPIQQVMCEILFEECEFKSVCRTTAASLCDFKYSDEHKGTAGLGVCTLVVDSGYSFTHIIPFINGMKVNDCIKRINVGGKLLTNCLKEILSYRQLHVLDETYLINQVKEDLCYMSSDFKEDMNMTKLRFPDNTIIRDYVLPDYTTIKRGFIRPLNDTGIKSLGKEQILRMNNERITIPEILMRPSDVGINQMGIAEGIVKVIKSFPEAFRSHFCTNIILTGGNAKFPGFKERLEKDLRADLSIHYDISIYIPENPITYAWEGGKLFAKDPEYSKYCVSRKEYDEKGLGAFSGIADI